MKTIRASRFAALLLVIFMMISLFPAAGLAEEDAGEAAPVAESVPEESPAEAEEQVEAEEAEETEWETEEIADEAVPEAVPSLPEEQVQDQNTDENAESNPEEPNEETTPTDPPVATEDQVQAQSIEGDVEAAGVDEPGQNGSDDSQEEFTVTLADDTCIYDGEEHWNTNTPVCEPSDDLTTYSYAYSFEEEGEYVADLTSLKKTDAGEYTIYVKATSQANGEEAEISAETTAKLIISKREVSVKAKDYETEYTGSQLRGSEELEFVGLLEGHLATIDYEPATGTEVGTHDNGSFDEDSFKVIVKPVNEEDTPEEEDADREDAGEESTGKEETGGEDNDEEDEDNSSNDEDDTPETLVTSNYTLKDMTPGKLEITEPAPKIEVTVTSADAEWTYDGYEHSSPLYTVMCGDEAVEPADESGLVFTLPRTGDTLTILEPAKVKIVSDTAENNNTFTYKLTNAEQNDVQENYDVQTNYGTLTINSLEQATVTITGNSDTKTYSGSAQSVSGYEFSAKAGETVLSSDDFTVELAADKKAEAVGTDTGTYAMGLTKDDFTVKNSNCGNIIVEYTDGTLTIQKLYVKVTITGHNDKSVYDGKEHSVSGYDVECSENLYAQNLASNITFTGNAYAARTNVSAPSEREGTTYMGLKEDQFSNRNTNFNAQFEVVDGYQTIERKRLVVTTGGGEKVYDATPLKNAEATLTGLVEGETATVLATGEQTNVGSSYNTYEIKWGSAKVGNYVVAYTRGVLKVTRATVTIKVKAQSYPYNGKPQGEDNRTYTDPKVISEKVEVNGLKGKDRLLSITLKGQQTEIGTYEKEKAIALSKVLIGTDPKASTSSNKNYEVRWTRGTLTITEADSESSSGSSNSSGSGSGSSGSSYSGGGYSGYDFSSDYDYGGGYINSSDTAEANSAVNSYDIPLEIGGVNAGTGESYE